MLPTEPTVPPLEADDSTRETSGVWAFAAPVIRLATSADQPAGSVSEPFADAVKKAAIDPSIFDTHPPYIFRALISNQKLDAYYTRMHETTLQNFATDATDGVSFQNSHRSTELGFGRSFRGEYLGSPGNGTARTEADFYTIPGVTLNGVPTDDLIRGLKSGLIRDVSVGFYGGTMRCGTCQQPLFTKDCRHWPGLAYDRDGKPTDNPDAPPSMAWVHDARLAEVSAVYDGACPSAAIMKARQMSESGELPGAVARLLEVRYRIKLPGAARAFPGVAMKEIPMPDEITLTEGRAAPTPAPAPVPAPSFGAPQLRALLEAAGLPPAESDEVNLRSLTEAVKKLPALEAERERLAKLADDGRQYREDLTTRTLAEGVRAYGAEKFPSEQYRVQFEQAPLDFIKTNLDLWTAKGDEILKGGRQSADVGQPEPKDTAPAVHRAAYAAG